MFVVQTYLIFNSIGINVSPKDSFGTERNNQMGEKKRKIKLITRN